MSIAACEASTTGRRVLLPDRTASNAYSPQMAEVVAATGCEAWASLPMRSGRGVIGVLTAGWRSPQVFDVEQLDLLETLASQCAQALARITALVADGTFKPPKSLPQRLKSLEIGSDNPEIQDNAKALGKTLRG